MAASKIVCMLATLSDSLFSGKGRGDWEAFEGLLQRVGSLEGSLGLLSQDFHPWTMVNPSSLVEGATRGVVVEADSVFCSGGGGKLLLGSSLGLCSFFHQDLFLPGDLWTSQGGISTSLVSGSFSLTTHLHGDRFQLIQWGFLLPPYDLIVLLLQTVDPGSLQKGGPGCFIVLPSSTPFGGLVAGPIRVEGSLTQPLHVVRRGLCPREVCPVIQLFFLKNYFVAPPPRLDPFCVVIKVLEAVPMHLLIEIVQEYGVPQGVLLFYEVPPDSVLLHMSGDRNGEGLSFLCSDITNDGDMVQVCSVSILFQSFSPKIWWVPRAEATQLNRRSRGDSTERGECSALRSQLAPSLLKSLPETRPAPSPGLILGVLSWSLSDLGRGSLTFGGESSTMAYGGSLVLQLL